LFYKGGEIGYRCDLSLGKHLYHKSVYHEHQLTKDTI